MATEDEVVDTSTPSTTSDAAPEREIVHDPIRTDRDTSRKTIKESLKAAFDEEKRQPSAARQEAAAKRAREEQTGKFAPGTKESTASQAQVETPAASSEATQVPTTAKPAEVAPASTPAADVPTSWSKEAKATWASIPPAAQQAVLKREKEVADGFARYQVRSQDIDQAITPARRARLQQLGIPSEGRAIDQLFGWEEALRDPQRRVQAFRTLAQQYGIDPSTLAQAPGQSQQVDPNDPRQFVQQAVQPLFQEINALKAEREAERQAQLRRTHETVAGDIATFSKDKTHFDKVRVAMGKLMASGYATDLNDAYDKATWADPEIRSEILAEQTAKQQADAKAAQEAQAAKAAEAEAERKRKEREAADKARKANVSPRGSTPAGSVLARNVGSKSVRESIAETLKGRRASV